MSHHYNPKAVIANNIPTLSYQIKKDQNQNNLAVKNHHKEQQLKSLQKLEII